MDLFDALSLIGGLCLFLFGMDLMGQALERSAGSKLEWVLGKLTAGKLAGLLTGLGVTAVIQSSSATTVMVVGFVNSGLMSLRQAIGVIMGANIGTTVTAWILSLGGIASDNLLMQLLKPTSFTPVLALIGIALYMFGKGGRKKDIGTILLGFAVLMFGMDTMTNSVSGLAEVPAFQELFLMFRNPILGVLAGAVLTAIIQSSSASVGILQALAATGQITYGAAIPIIMGQNIGTCITAILSSFGTNKNARRAAIVHLSFNVIGTCVWLSVYALVDALAAPVLFSQAATLSGIAVAHSAFNIACTILLFPLSGLLEKAAYLLIPEDETTSGVEKLDERLLATPVIALERAHALTAEMAGAAIGALSDAMECLTNYSAQKISAIEQREAFTDQCEDQINTYLIKLSATALSDAHSNQTAELLKIVGDLERIGDHGLNVAQSATEIHNKKLTFTDESRQELENIRKAVDAILNLTQQAFVLHDPKAARQVQALEQVVDELKARYRTSHIHRLQKGRCSVEAGFVWSDILTDLERVADHCDNIASCVLDDADHVLNIHHTDQEIPEPDPRTLAQFRQEYLQ